MFRGHLDTTAGGTFLSLTIDGATALTNKMVSNPKLGEERKTQKGMHTVKEPDMLSAKNRSFDEKIGETGPRERCHDGHHLGHGLTHDE